MTPTEANVHGDAVCFMMGRTQDHGHTIEQWVGVGGSWRLAVGGSWRLVAVGGPWGLSLTKKDWVLKESPGGGGDLTQHEVRREQRVTAQATGARRRSPGSQSTPTTPPPHLSVSRGLPDSEMCGR